MRAKIFEYLYLEMNWVGFGRLSVCDSYPWTDLIRILTLQVLNEDIGELHSHEPEQGDPNEDLGEQHFLLSNNGIQMKISASSIFLLPNKGIKSLNFVKISASSILTLSNNGIQTTISASSNLMLSNILTS